MKANPGGQLSGDNIIGRDAIIDQIWAVLEKQSVVLTSERRVGKSHIMKKMKENPRNGWTPILCYVESGKLPIYCVQKIYDEMDALEVLDKKTVVMEKIKKVWNGISKAEFGGWKLPEIETEWKALLSSLFEDAANSPDTKLLIMLDEFPQLTFKIMEVAGAATAMEFLDAFRELRLKWEDTGRIRIIISGSIGFHLVLKELSDSHSYHGKPTNDMKTIPVSGMTREETAIMCQKLLEEEGIARDSMSFDESMHDATDGLPIYIQHVCEKFQDSRLKKVETDDIGRELDALMNDTTIKWFRDVSDRIKNYYARIGMDRIAYCVLDELSRLDDDATENDVVNYVNSMIDGVEKEAITETLNLLLQDHYLERSLGDDGVRRYRFLYKLMKKWWKANRG